MSFVSSETARPFTEPEQAFIMATLNDPRSFGCKWRRTPPGTVPDWRITLERQSRIDALGVPLTGLSVTIMGRSPPITLFSYENWTRVPSPVQFVYSRPAYRTYLLLHECGHALGLGHTTTCGAGGLAPVMMQQTRGLRGCVPNVWPLPSERGPCSSRRS